MKRKRIIIDDSDEDDEAPKKISQKPPEIHHIKGPQADRFGAFSLATTHGNAKSQVDIRQLSFPEQSRIIITAHGTHSDGKHQIQLYSSLGHASGVDYTSYNFQAIAQASKNKPVNVELFSCFGGYAINDIAHLPKDSTLTSFVSEKNPIFLAISEELAAKSSSFIQPDNQFTRFASYLVTNADDTYFAINAGPNRIFRSNIESLQDFSDSGIKTWQKNQIKEYSKFLAETKEHTNDDNKAKIEQFQNLANNEASLNNFINTASPKNYREILLINAFNRKESSSIVKLLNSGIDINTELLPKYGFTPLHLAIASKNKDAVELIIARGADINKMVNGSEGVTAIHMAAESGDKEILKTLLINGANVEQQTSRKKLTALEIAKRCGHSEATQMLEDFAWQERTVNAMNKENIVNFQQIIANASETVRSNLARSFNLGIEKLSKQGKAFTIKTIISLFPEKERLEYFSATTKKALIALKKQNNPQKIDIILSSFPKAQDKPAINPSSYEAPNVTPPMNTPNRVTKAIKTMR